jgi:CheY-like chemotaxis protein
MDSLSLLAGSVAHDLNNILTSVLGFGTLLAERVASDPEASGNAREVLAAADRAARLTQQLLAFSRRQLLEPTSVNVVELIEDMREDLRVRLGSGVQIDVSRADVVPAAHVDAERLKDALLALVDNAKDAMAGGGTLTLTVDSVTFDTTQVAEHHYAAAGPYVRIAVTDTGAGMTREVQERIFDPFFTTKPRGEGDGLGLSTVYGFIRQTGGFIRVISEPQSGTTMSLHLPMFDTAQPTCEKVAMEPLRPSAGETILVVDDVDEIRALTAETLRKAGYKVITAGSASEALYMASMQRGPIQLLLTDIVMPGSSGLDLAMELKADRRGLRVLYMSGFTDTAIGRGKHLGRGEAFLPKPFTSQALLQQVAALLT